MSNDTRNDGGPAFPIPGLQHDESFNGMTLRDYFAGKVIEGLCANPGGPVQGNDRTGWGFVNCTTDGIASDVYALADAMLKARRS
jgi:hypothetical protein